MSKYLKALENKKRKNFRRGSYSSSSSPTGVDGRASLGATQSSGGRASFSEAFGREMSSDSSVNNTVEEEEKVTSSAGETSDLNIGDQEQNENEEGRKKAPLDIQMDTPPKAEITNVKEGLAADVSLDPEASKQFTTSEDEVFKISEDTRSTERDAKDVTAKTVKSATAGDAAKADTDIGQVTAGKYESVTTSDLAGEDQDLFGQAPQGVAATVLKKVDVRKTQTSQEAGQTLANNSGVEAGLSDSIANDPVGALDKIEGTDIESRANIAALPEEALMSTQIDGLLAGMEEGKTPLWAKPAVDKVNAMMAARGMTASTVGRDALFTAIISAAMPIAQDNAKALQARAAQTLDAAVQFTKQEADFEQQMKITNLANQQQAFIQSRELSQQRLLSDQNAKNASLQFNAANQQQTDQFMTSMRNNVSQFNASQDNAMKQFNTSEINKINALNAGNQLQADQFNEQMVQDAQKFYESNVLQREQFNASNAQAIQQSDLAWRRNTNSAATAAFNAANQQNVQNEYNMTALDQAQVWLQMRDSMAYIRQNYENEEQRIAQLYATAIGNEAAMGAKSSATTTKNQKASADFIDQLFA